jgi:hypothetical protein
MLALCTLLPAALLPFAALSGGPDPAAASAGTRTDWMSSSQLDALRVAGHEDLLYPDTIEGRVDSAGKVQYRAVFEPYPPGMNYYYAYWAMSDDWFEKRDKELTSKGFKLHSHTTFVNQAGAQVHQAVWLMWDDLPDEAFADRSGFEAFLEGQGILPAGFAAGEAGVVGAFVAFLTLFVYLVLQLRALGECRGGWRVLAVLPFMLLAALGGLAAAGGRLPEDWPTYLIGFTILAIVWLFGLRILQAQALRRQREAVATSDPVRWS